VVLTPQLRTGALLATLRANVTRRSGKGPTTMTVTVCLPATEVISIDALASAGLGSFCPLKFFGVGDRPGGVSRRNAHSPISGTGGVVWWRIRRLPGWWG
jgi:hypothetical protein